MGLLLGVSMMILLNTENEAGRLNKAVATTGLTSAFMLIFTVITFLMGFWGFYVTRRRDLPGYANVCYGGCLFFFVMIPLFVVGVGS